MCLLELDGGVGEGREMGSLHLGMAVGNHLRAKIIDKNVQDIFGTCGRRPRPRWCGWQRHDTGVTG